MAAGRSTAEYRPPRWLVALVASSVGVFAALGVFLFLSSTGIYYSLGSLVLVVVSGLGLAEVLVSRVTLEPEAVRVRSLFGSDCIALREVDEVRLDGGRTYLRMKSGGWKKLPEWLGASMSLRHRIANRLAELSAPD